MKGLLITILSGICIVSNASEVTNIVEFFSFTCSHCAHINSKLEAYIAKHHIKYMDVNIDNSPEAMPTNRMYYLAIDAGVGSKFKNTYFKAISSGLLVNSPDTLAYVVRQVKNPKMEQLMLSQTESIYLDKKLDYANQLLATYKIQGTPSFLINQTAFLEGEDVITSFIEGDHE